MPDRSFDSVWDAIENTPADAAQLRIRSQMMMALQDHIERSGLSQAQAAKIPGITQPRISDLMRGKIDLSASDSLVSMLAAAGLQVEPRVAAAA